MTTKLYKHTYMDGTAIQLPVGKVLCVGRNFVDHIAELDNEPPSEPVLFMKPSTAIVPIDQPIILPTYGKICHHEIEVAVLIGEQLKEVDPKKTESAILGYTVGLDMTLRDVQVKLQKMGRPWELCKAFDNSYPLAPFIRKSELPDIKNIEFSLTVNGHIRQQSNTNNMIYKIHDLISHISRHFTLFPGDVISTGTPAGVDQLNPKDRLSLSIGEKFRFNTVVG